MSVARGRSDVTSSDRLAPLRLSLAGLLAFESRAIGDRGLRRSAHDHDRSLEETMKRTNKKPISYDTLLALALALPGVEEGTSYATPALKVKGKLMVRLKEDGDSVVLVIGFDNREILMQANPEAFYITDHYRNYPTVLVRLSRVSAEELRTVVELTWRNVAPKKLVKARKDEE
jgi:hypothetical protein